jgi:hypothetical protein
MDDLVKQFLNKEPLPPPKPIAATIEIEAQNRPTFDTKDLPEDQQVMELVAHIMFNPVDPTVNGRQAWIPLKNTETSKWQVWLDFFRELGVPTDQICDYAYMFEIRDKVSKGRITYTNMLVPVALLSDEEVQAIKNEAAAESREELVMSVLPIVDNIFDRSEGEMPFDAFVARVFELDAGSGDPALLPVLTSRDALGKVPGIVIENDLVKYTPDF